VRVTSTVLDIWDSNIGKCLEEDFVAKSCENSGIVEEAKYPAADSSCF
jgi:hypothetical protein